MFLKFIYLLIDIFQGFSTLKGTTVAGMGIAHTYCVSTQYRFIWYRKLVTIMTSHQINVIKTLFSASELAYYTIEITKRPYYYYAPAYRMCKYILIDKEY